MRTAIDRPTVAAAIVSALREHGVRKAFGIPGVHNLALWWELGEAGIDRVIVRHEQTAMYAADGFARASGDLGVCVTTSGPGAANTAAATGEALTAGSPVLHITTSTPLGLRGPDPSVRRGTVHDLPDQAGIFAPLVKSRWVLDNAERAVHDVRAAMLHATSGWCGPVYVEVPTDIFGGTGGAVSAADPGAPAPADALLSTVPEEVGAVLAQARRPVVWAGYGAMEADVGALASHLGAPIVTTLMARSAVDSAHPLAVNAPPHEPAVTALVEEADVLVALGTDFDGQVTQNWQMRLPDTVVRVDLTERQLSVNASPAHPLHMDARRFVASVLETVPGASPAAREAGAERAEQVRREVMSRLAAEDGDLDAWRVIDDIGRTLPGEVPVVADMTLAGYWASGYLRRSRLRTFMFPMGWGTLGFSLPTAIGVAHAVESPVVVLVGDAGLLFNVGELATVRERDLPLITVVFNDQAYAMLAYGIEDEERVGGLRDLTSPDVMMLAAAFGISGERTTHVELPDRLAAAVAAGEPAVIEVPNLARPPVSTGVRWPLRRRSADAAVPHEETGAVPHRGEPIDSPEE